MALDATLGAINANSYVTQVEADAYFTDRMHSSSWEDLTEDQKDTFLISASRMLDWFIKWKGSKSTTTQAMAWPRINVIRPDGTEVDSDTLPAEIKIATYEQAFINISSDRTLDDPLAGIGKLAVGSLLIQAGPEKPNQTNAKPVPNHVYSIVSDLYNSGGTVWLLRA